MLTILYLARINLLCANENNETIERMKDALLVLNSRAEWIALANRNLAVFTSAFWKVRQLATIQTSQHEKGLAKRTSLFQLARVWAFTIEKSCSNVHRLAIDFVTHRLRYCLFKRINRYKIFQN